MDIEGINVIEDDKAVDQPQVNTADFVQGNGERKTMDDLDFSGINVVDDDERSNAPAEEKRKTARSRNHPGEVARKSKQLQEKDAQIADLNARLEQLSEQTYNAQYAAQQSNMVAAHNERVANINNENALLTRRASAEKDLEFAMEEGNAKKVAELTSVIATTASQLQDLDNRKNNYQEYARQQEYDNSPPPPRARPRPTPQEEYYPEEESQPVETDYDEDLNNDAEDFLIENPALDKANKDRFNPRLYDRYIRHAQDLADKYDLEGRKELVGTKAFYEEASEAVYKGLNAKVTSTKPNQTQRSSSMVAPVGRGGSNYGSGGATNVTRAELDMLSAFAKAGDLNKGKSIQQLAAQYKKIQENMRATGRLGQNLQQKR